MQRSRTAPESDPARGDDRRDGQALALAGARRARIESVVAEDVDASQSMIGRIRARYVRLRQGGAGVVLGRDVEVRQGGGWVMAGAELNVQQGAAQWMVGGLVQAKQVYTVALVAGRVEGQVRCLLDARGAFALGAGAALVTGLFRLLRRK